MPRSRRAAAARAVRVLGRAKSRSCHPIDAPTFVIYRGRSIAEGLVEIFRFEKRVVGDQCAPVRVGGQEFQYATDSNSHSANARLSAALPWVNGHAIKGPDCRHEFQARDSCLMQDEPELAIGFSRKMSLKGKDGMLGIDHQHGRHRGQQPGADSGVSGRQRGSAVCRASGARRCTVGWRRRWCGISTRAWTSRARGWCGDISSRMTG